MKYLQWSSKKRCLSHATRNLRAVAKQHKKQIERAEMVVVELNSADRALLQSAKSDLAKCSDSPLNNLVCSAALGAVIKHGLATFWKWIVSKNLIYFLSGDNGRSNHTSSIGRYAGVPAFRPFGAVGCCA